MVIHSYILLTEKNIYFFIFFSRFYHFYAFNVQIKIIEFFAHSIIKIHHGMKNFNLK